MRTPNTTQLAAIDDLLITCRALRAAEQLGMQEDIDRLTIKRDAKGDVARRLLVPFVIVE